MNFMRLLQIIESFLNQASLTSRDSTWVLEEKLKLKLQINYLPQITYNKLF